MRRTYIVGVVLAIAAGFATGQGSPAQAGAASDVAAVDVGDAEMRKIIEALGDKNFAVREAAQKALDGIPLGQRDAFAKMIDKVTDEEVKARMMEHLGVMDERIAINPPPISVDLTDANLALVAAALSKETGTTIRTQPSDWRFTLKAEAPFWEIMRQFERQHPVWLTDDPPTMTQQSFKNHVVIGGIAVSADDPVMSNVGKFSVAINVSLDPRINVIDLHAMQVDDARDDQHHLFHLDSDPLPAAGRAGRAAIRLPARNTATQRFYQSKNFKFSDDDAAGKIVTIKGTVNFMVAISQSSTEVANAGKHLNEAISIGDSTVTLHEILPGAPDAAGNKREALQLDIVPNGSAIKAPPLPNVQITATGISMGGLGATAGTQVIIDNEGSAGGIFMGTAASGGGPSTRIVVTDGTGKTVANYTLSRGMPVTSVHVLTGAIQEPLTFKFSYPTKTHEVTLPFEFKDLPIQR